MNFVFIKTSFGYGRPFPQRDISSHHQAFPDNLSRLGPNFIRETTRRQVI